MKDADEPRINQSRQKLRRRLTMLTVVTSLLVMANLSPAVAASGGTPGPCRAGTVLEGSRLGWDVSWVARNVGTPLPQVFAFSDPDAPPPMPPGQLVQFAREAGMC